MTAVPTRPVLAPTPERFVGGYGHRWTQGVISEHVEAFVRAGGVVRAAKSGSGAQWALVGTKAYPVLCSDIIAVDTEDGKVTGRCGLLATRYGACAGHADEADAWREMAEAERAAWERDRDGLPVHHFVD